MEPTWVSECGTVRLWLGDCIEAMESWADGAIDCVVTDPPYGVNFAGRRTKQTSPSGGYNRGDCPHVGPLFMRQWNGRAVVFSGTRILHDYPKPADIGAIYCPAGAGRGPWGFTMYNPILYYGKCPYLQSGAGSRPNSMSYNDRQPRNGHPCPKPLPWMKFAILKGSASTSDTIADPFMGSGTTGVAAVRLGRSFWGVEIDQAYFEIAKRRIREELASAAFLNPKPIESQAEFSL